VMLEIADPDGSASRSYYAAFHAVSALFVLEGSTFRKHTAVEAAVHRDLARTGRWAAELGRDFSSLAELRSTGDYGGALHVAPHDARLAIAAARRILEAVRVIHPDVFPAELQEGGD
ncbi:MAG: HEPN domain-containing protein, partial [Deltaproteobacteria bacterium]|nr:HEPN domain-containing protein [Deltaproteobacteria bacterium]